MLFILIVHMYTINPLYSNEFRSTEKVSLVGRLALYDDDDDDDVTHS